MDFAQYKNTCEYPGGSSQDPATLAARRVYHDEDARLYKKFKADFFEELAIIDNAKREKLFTVAWEFGHSAGYSEVMNYGYSLVDLIND